MKAVIAGFATVLLVAATVRAQEPPKPAPELAQLKVFEGSWMCEGNSPAGPFGPAHKTRSAWQTKLDLDGFWYTGTVTEMNTPENPHPVRGMFHEGYDGAAKQFLMIWVDNFGTWATETSPGWQGDTMVFTGDQNVMGEKATARDTFVKKGNTEVTHRYDLNMKGQW
ncbi:MAG: DUF1579 family protein, partial [Thermoanaerobaculia bacterium]